MGMTAEGLKTANKKLQTLSIKGKDYVQVTERVKAFRDLCPDGSITTEVISMDGEMVIIKATVTDGEKILATGLAYEKESSSYINKTSYIENCETSAVGRALGFCGIGIDASMASAEELVNAIAQQEQIKATEKMQQTKATKAVKDVIVELCKRHNVNLSLWLKQINATMDDLTAEQGAAMLQGLKQKYGDA